MPIQLQTVTEPLREYFKTYLGGLSLDNTDPILVHREVNICFEIFSYWLCHGLGVGIGIQVTD